jgi:prepilin-type N-terminal cleavage/methylation domain-containing protein
MQVLKKSCFTLIEMLVVLLLLSTGIALTGVKIKQAYNEQRKLSDVQQVLNCLIMAQDLMLMMNADVEVILKHNPGSKAVICRLEVEKPVDKAWSKIVEKQIELSCIRSFQFNGYQTDPLHLRFTLGKMSQGTLTLSINDRSNFGSNDQDDAKIVLSGYPSPIVQFNKNEEIKEIAALSPELYPAEIYEELYSKTKKK